MNTTVPCTDSKTKENVIYFLILLNFSSILRLASSYSFSLSAKFLVLFGATVAPTLAFLGPSGLFSIFTYTIKLKKRVICGGSLNVNTSGLYSERPASLFVCMIVGIEYALLVIIRY